MMLKPILFKCLSVDKTTLKCVLIDAWLLDANEDTALMVVITDEGLT